MSETLSGGANSLGANPLGALAHPIMNIRMNRDLFNKQVVTSCFNQCAKTDIDVVFAHELECTYKCMITYKDAFEFLNS